ncbi:tRNA (adenosine(37)-N6)-dimethylallyltransferase MiaA [Natronoglycomyces albus]|uniref:tRNA (adenosine(37)-N6)-dimethylallyltransferase MiaA n=1 Tax=Natronoglycomyces albus TaxID=2811108 RepID=UPI001FE338DD|nr:tRNA (adenosine(37)-N6)-dimethylallyltransferase MiaA [Natronoglycomyces albus]
MGVVHLSRGGNTARLPGRTIAVVGPTAAGKTALSIAVAHTLDGEVINADSMQLYEGMDIGTAKADLTERDGVPHHLFDIWDCTVSADVASYQKLARAAIDEVSSRGKQPLLVGGSGLYIQAVLDEFNFPGTDPEIRSRWEARLQEVGADALHAELAARDAKAAEAILPSNGRRIVRALEVIELTGSFVAALPEPREEYPAVRIGIDLDTAQLDHRIELRVERMWEAGLVEEVRQLASRGLGEGKTASRALGYKQVLEFLAGKCSEEEAKLATVVGTRRFVRRQRSWFKRDKRITWFDGSDADLLEKVLEHLETHAIQI